MNVDIEIIINEKKIIGEGARRLVYDLGNGNVIKVAKSKYGIRSNKREVKTYYSAPSRVKKHIAKIREYDKGFYWLIMKKYAVHFPKSRKYKKKLDKVRTEFRGHGIIPYEVVGRHGKPNFQNLRLKTSGKIVVIDYGNFEFYRKWFK
jgi:hypothetical protein